MKFSIQLPTKRAAVLNKETVGKNNTEINNPEQRLKYDIKSMYVYVTV